MHSFPNLEKGEGRIVWGRCAVWTDGSISLGRGEQRTARSTGISGESEMRNGGFRDAGHRAKPCISLEICKNRCVRACKQKNTGSSGGWPFSFPCSVPGVARRRFRRANTLLAGRGGGGGWLLGASGLPRSRLVWTSPRVLRKASPQLSGLLREGLLRGVIADHALSFSFCKRCGVMMVLQCGGGGR